MSAEEKPKHPVDLLVDAEQRGLRLAIGCRTIASGAALLWLLAIITIGDFSPSPWAFFALAFFTLYGLVHALIIGTKLDRWWMKYAVYAADILVMCACFAYLPVSRSHDIPQIIAFRAYGIYFLFPFLCMAALSLSWRLVLWSGVIAVIGWWTAFGIVVADMQTTLTWSEIPEHATVEDYQRVFLSIDFIGLGNRVQESGLLLASAIIIAIVVYRARGLFFAQLEAEAGRNAAMQEQRRISDLLGRYVPEPVAMRLIANPDSLRPQVKKGTVLVLDIAGFTAYAAAREPAEVIKTLNSFLAGCSDCITAHGGIVISYTGDGLLASFNVPLEITEKETAAVETAIALKQIAASRQFDIRIGIASGEVAAGSIGSSDRQSFTIYGTTVNLASRLEQYGKEQETWLLIDENTCKGLQDQSLFRPLGQQRLRGLPGNQQLYAAKTG